MRGEGWRQCLCAVLLAASVADVASDLNDDDPADSRSGNQRNIVVDSNESKADTDDAEGFAESLSDLGIPEYHDNDDRRGKNTLTLDLDPLVFPGWNQKDDPINKMWDPKGSILLEPSIFPPEYKFPVRQVDMNDAGPTQLHGNFDVLNENQLKETLEPVEHDELVSHKDPTYETVVLDNEYSLSSNNSSLKLGSALFTPPHFFSKLIPHDEHISLDKLSGAENIIQCLNEGEIHNFWAPGHPCMMCVCLAAYGHLRPVCVSCQECLAPEPTTHRPPVPPYTPPPPPDDVSCKPLPVNVPFQSPMDPCKICVCTETRSQWGKVDVRIQCQRNRQCVLPTTPRTHVSTPVPLPVCAKFPPNVPFPHPHDACKICQCTATRTRYGQVETQIICYPSPECQPTSTPPPDITDLPPPEFCDRYPENVPFPHPYDQCQVCKCTVHRGQYKDIKKITCYVKPSCLPDFETTTEPVTVTPEPVSTPPPSTTLEPVHLHPCGKYPDDVIFQDPVDQCKLCKCYKDPRNGFKAVITCFLKAECVLPSTTEHYVPRDICEKYPVNTPFEDPNDQCRTCTCSYTGSPAPGAGLENTLPQLQILCNTKPECLPPPPPPSPTTEYPDYDVCRKYPINSPFDDPNDQCRTCTCSYIASAAPGAGLQNALPQLQILCHTKPECSFPPPPPPTTEYPDYDVCRKYPINTPFNDPNDKCRTCTCSYIGSPAPGAGLQNALPQLQILCHTKPECLLPPPPPPTTEYPDYDVCGKYPINTPFDDPNDQCRTCTCSYIGSVAPGAGLQSALPQLQILCHTKPECLLPPTTEHPDYNLCGKYPLDTPFDYPNDECRTCICTQIGSAPPAPGSLQNSYYTTRLPTQLQILCQIKPECLPTERTERTTVCDSHEVDVPFDDPRDPCRTCVCYWGSQGSAPGQGLMNALPIKLYKCVLKPECVPTPPPITEEPEPHSICQNYPVDMPFTDPRDPCYSCVCYWSFPGAPPGGTASTALGHAAPSGVKLVKCTLKPECRPPTPEPITKSPLPDVTCKPLPSGKPFQSPLNPCQICTCTETVDVYGRPDVVFKCQQNPQCVVPYDITTVPPDSHTVPLPACAQFPTNVEFPHPSDPCRLCKCTVQRNPWGQLEQLINCYTNPECGITSTTAAPWPPAPPGPLPGPAPHESCSPYAPNQPFQHPWDECQVCVCREARTSDRITIEVNCYTKPSCCYEPPFDIPGLPDSGSIDAKLLIDGSGSSSINSGSGNSYQWKYEKENGIETGGNGNIIGQIGGNVISSSGGNLIGPADSHFKIPDGRQIYDQNAYNIELSNIDQQKHWLDEKWISAQGDGQISIKENLIKPSENFAGYANGNFAGGVSGNIIGQTESKVISPIRGDVIGPSGGHLIVNADGSFIRGTSENLYGSNVGNLYGTYSGKYKTASENIKENMYVPDLENLFLKPKESGNRQGLWRQTYGYKLKPEAALEFKVEGDASLNGLNANVANGLAHNQHNSKMRTKSARPKDSTSEDYD